MRSFCCVCVFVSERVSQSLVQRESSVTGALFLLIMSSILASFLLLHLYAVVVAVVSSRESMSRNEHQNQRRRRSGSRKRETGMRHQISIYDSTNHSLLPSYSYTVLRRIGALVSLPLPLFTLQFFHSLSLTSSLVQPFCPEPQQPERANTKDAGERGNTKHQSPSVLKGKWLLFVSTNMVRERKRGRREDGRS